MEYVFYGLLAVAFIAFVVLVIRSYKLLFQYGFGELNLEKIWTEIYEFDSPKYELYKKINFQQDGILRRQYFHDGKWWDSYILSLLKDEFKGE